MSLKVLEELRSVLPEKDVPAVERCATTLREALPRPDALRENTVMVAYGGGKDSAYAVAFVRAVHLVLKERHGETFELRVVTMRHGGMPYQVMLNIDRTYRALDLYADPDVELLLIEGDSVRPFERDRPMPYTILAFNRIDMLMSGHRAYGDGRATFCNACNVNVANSFGVAAGYDGGVDLIITGDSPREQRDYAMWIHKLARDAGQKPVTGRKGFKGTLEVLNGLATSYFQEIHGKENAERINGRGVSADVPTALSFFSIYDYTSYASGAHWRLLTGFLDFVFDEIAFNFTESDCTNPALMAHLRGLRTEHAYGGSYAEGIGQYVDFGLDLMRRKHFPDHLIEQMRERYSTEAGIEHMRSLATSYAEDAYGLTTAHLVCLVWSPFAGRAANLREFLAAEHPDLQVAEDRIRALLAGATDHEMATRMEHISGMSVTDLRVLHDGPLWSPLKDISAQSPVFQQVMTTDPNQKIISVRSSHDGDEFLDRVAGR